MTRSARALSSVVALVIVVAGAAAWWILHDRASLTTRGPRDARPVAGSDAPEPAGATPLAASRGTEAREKKPAASTAPDSYRRALGAFKGRLLEPDRAPAARLPVSAVEFEPSRFLLEAEVLLDEKRETPPIESARAVTGDDGVFLLEGLEPRAVHLLGIDLGGPRSAFRIVDMSPISGQVVDLGDIVLEPFVTFVGRVIDEDGKPVAGARVRATNFPAAFVQIGLEFGLGDVRRGCGIMIQVMDAPKAFDVPPVVWDYEKLLPVPTTSTDEAGRFRLPGVPLGMVTVVADKAGFKATSKATPSGKGPERDVRDLVLGGGYALAGVVTTGAGEPRAGVEVLAGIRAAALPAPVALLHPAGRTDERGAFSLKGLPSGSEAYVATRASRGQPWNVHGPFKTDEEILQVRLSPPSGLLVRMHDEAGKVLDEKAKVELFVAPDPIEGGAPLPPLLAPPMQKLTEVVAVEPGLARVSGLDFGKYRLIGRAAGYALAQATIEVADPPREFELSFQAANSLEISVVRCPDDRPLEWAFASLCPEGFFERPIARGRTDEDGKVTLERIPAGKYVLTVQHPSKATDELKVEIPSPPLRVALAVGGNLKGRAHDRGRDPGKSLFVILTQKDVKRPDAAMPTFSVTAETGDFYVPNLEAGEYRYEFRDRLVGKGPLALFETMRDDPLARGEFRIREEETTEIAVDVSGAGDGPSAEIFGLVRVNGVPAADLSIRVEGPRNVTAKSDERGEWRLESIPAGKSTLTVQGLKAGGDFMQLASVMHREELDLAGGDVRRIDLDLRVGAVSGRVTGPGPLPSGIGTTVLLRSPDGGPAQFSAVNPLTGSYEFPTVPAGAYDLMVRKRGAAPFTTSIVVDPARGEVEVDVELVDSITASGTIVLPKDAPPLPKEDLPRSWLVLIDAQSRPAGRGRVDWATNGFTIDDCAEGEYSAQLFRGDATFVARKVTIARGASSDLVLAFEKPAEGEKLVDPLGGMGARPFGRRRGN
jgi:hypothetical protein